MIKTIESKLVCLKCGDVFPTVRKAGNQKGLFQENYSYCIKCKKRTKHIETKDLDFLIASMEHKEKESLSEEEKRVYQLIKNRGKRI